MFRFTSSTATVLVAVLLLLWAYPATAGNSAPPPCDHDCLMAQARQLLEARNAREAQRLFGKAAKNKATGKDPTKKAAAKQMQEKAKKHYPAIFSGLREVDQLVSSRSLLKAYRTAQSTLGKIKSCAAIRVAQFTDFDEEIISSLTERSERINTDRVAAIEEALKKGQSLMTERDYATAATNFEYAHGLCLPEEKNTYGTGELVREANYGKHFLRGERLLDQQKCAGAHAAFKEAYAILAKNEAQVQIDAAADCAYEELMEKGQSQLGNDDCQKARSTFLSAATFKPGDELAKTSAQQAGRCLAEKLLTTAASAYEAKDYQLAANKLNEAEQMDSRAKKDDSSIGDLRTTYYEGVLRIAEAQERDKKYSNAKKYFLLAGKFKNATEMLERAELATAKEEAATAYTAAQTRQNNSAQLKTISDFTQLREAWQTAKTAADKAKLNGTDVEAKLTAARDAERAVQNGNRLYANYVASGRKSSTTREAAAAAYTTIPFPAAIKDNNPAKSTTSAAELVTVRVKYYGISLDLHNNDCRRLKGKVLMALQQKGRNVRSTTNNRSLTTILDYNSTASRDYPVRRVEKTRSPRPLRQYDFKVDRRALANGEVYLWVDSQLLGCHKSGDFASDYRCNISHKGSLRKKIIRTTTGLSFRVGASNHRLTNHFTISVL